MAGGYPCSCCCAPVFSDNFDRADSDDVGADWVEASGTWAISGNVLRASASSSVIQLATFPAYGDVVQVKMRAQSAGDVLGLGLDSGYGTQSYLIFTFGSPGQLGISYDAATCSVALAAGVWHTIKLQVLTQTQYGGAIMGVWIDGVEVWRGQSFQTEWGALVLLAVTVATYAEFDDFIVWPPAKVNAKCPAPPTRCWPFEPVDEVQLDLAGFGDGTYCACSNLNGTYYLSVVPGFPSLWRYLSDTPLMCPTG
jgi:hypothetical protein